VVVPDSTWGFADKEEHKMIKTKLAAVAFSALAIGGIGAGVAHAAGAPATPKAPSVSQSVTSGTEAPDTTSGAETTTPETDGPGGHADADGANVDHQFNGTE
jgi:hypothetical protein